MSIEMLQKSPEQQIADLQNEIRRLRNEVNVIQQNHADAIAASCRDMIGKCFKRPVVDGKGTYEYAVISNAPTILRDRDGSTHINEYQLPSLHFYYNKDHIVAFENSENSHEEGILFYSTIFTGLLPDEYRKGNDFVRDTHWEEITPFDFRILLAARIDQVLNMVLCANSQ